MNVVILDTGCANLNSVKSAISRHGYEPLVSRDPDVVLRADKLFLPGVGTAQAAMDQLRERDLIELIKACTQPVLGICLGMQLLGVSAKRTVAWIYWASSTRTCRKWKMSVCRCRTWAGTVSIRKQAIACFRG
jgi:imidazole glycerol phosphate synthase glutamine amidotransferase subunit